MPISMKAFFTTLISVIFWSASCQGGLTADPATPEPDTSFPSVGMESLISVDIPGDLVIAKRTEHQSDIIVYIESFQTKNNTTTYQIHYIGNRPGTFDLASLLRRKNSTSHTPIPPIKVKIIPLLPEDHNGELIPARTRAFNVFESYNTVMALAGVTWAACLIPLVLWGRQKKVVEVVTEQVSQPTLEEILQPLLAAAENDTLDSAGKAQLEKAVYLQLQTRLNLGNASPHKMIQALKNDQESSNAIHILERWLHTPPSTSTSHQQLSPSDITLLTQTDQTAPTTDASANPHSETT